MRNIGNLQTVVYPLTSEVSYDSLPQVEVRYQPGLPEGRLLFIVLLGKFLSGNLLFLE